MNIPVLLEPTTQGFRATGGVPFDVSAEGQTEAAALDHLRDEIISRMSVGSKVVSLDLSSQGDPWSQLVGMFPEGDPIVQEWLEIMAERRHSEEDPWEGLATDTCSTPTP